MNASPQPPEFDRYARDYRRMHQNSIRASGEEPEYFAAYKIEYIARALPAEAAAAPAILDFGCGVGNSIPHIARLFPGARVHGVDVSGESVAMARDANPDARFDVMSSTLPLPDDSVDIALAACVYHHVPPAERAHWTAEVQRVLRPGGRFFIFEHNPLNPLTRKVVRDCPFDEDAILLPRRESVSLLEGAGFTDVDVDYIVFFPRPLGFLRPLERALTALPLGAQYAAAGRK